MQFVQILDKMIEKGLIEKPMAEVQVRIRFPNNSHIPPPVCAFKEVSFAYDGDKSNLLLRNMEFGIDMDSRIVLVGPNGAGKSTLQKVRAKSWINPFRQLKHTLSGLQLMVGELSPTLGTIQKHGKLQIARYNQHSEEILNVKMTPIDWIASEFPVPKVETTEWRKRLGRYGITGKAQTRLIETMSDGQKTQLVFAWLANQNPHLLLFDEPTNHLDMESIDGLAVRRWRTSLCGGQNADIGPAFRTRSMPSRGEWFSFRTISACFSNAQRRSGLSMMGQ